jgi:iron complex transport system substrate-binding protein
MRKIGRLSFVIVLILLLCLAAGCGENDKQAVNETDKNEITITDSTGKEIVLPEKLDKVAVLNPPAAEVLRILQVPDEAIAGVSDSIQKSAYLGFGSVESVGSSSTPNIEKIVELKPDAVITQGKWMSGLDEIRAKLEPVGIKVIALDIHQIEEYDECMNSLAKVFGKEKRAADFLKWKSGQEKKLSDRLKSLKQEEKKKVLQLYANKLAKNEWQTSSKGEQAGGTGPDQQINMAAGINVAKDLEQDYPTVSVEWILQQNPDVLLITSYNELGYTSANYDDASKVRDLVLANKAITQTNAGKNKQVFVNASLASTPYINAMFLAKGIYPEQMKDVEPQNVLKEYFEEWLGVPFKGCWVYPEQ